MGTPIDIEKYRTIGISASAVPSRKTGVAQRNHDQKQFQKDAAAYRRLRRDGTQPRRVDGSAELEVRADSKEQIEQAVFTGGKRVAE